MLSPSLDKKNKKKYEIVRFTFYIHIAVCIDLILLAPTYNIPTSIREKMHFSLTKFYPLIVDVHYTGESACF